MLSAYHSERKPWGIKAVALFVIFTFLATQSDVQLFASVAVPSVPAATPAPDPQADKIRYMQDLGQQQQDLQGQTSENPLNAVTPGQNQPNPFAGDIPQGQTPQISTSFLTGQNPLAGKTDVGAIPSEDPVTHIVTVNYQDGTYFKYNNTSNKIQEICDFTKPVVNAQTQATSYELEMRRFDYGTEASGTSYVRITTLDSDGVSAYQKFSVDPDGQLKNLLGTGYLIRNELNQDLEVPMTVYGGNRVTIYDRTDDSSYYIERTYEQLPAGESRLLSYQRIEGATTPIDLQIQYNDEKGILTVIDRSQPGATVPVSVSFWEYRLTELNKRGDLLAVGEMENTLTGAKVLSRMDIGATTYTITNPQDATQLVIFERLENGGFGRILRYRDTGVDLEYVYAMDAATSTETMTVLNYTANTYIKMSFIEGTAPDSSSGLIDSPRNILEAGTFTLTGTTPQYKKLLEKAPNGEWIVIDPSDGRIFDVYAAFPTDEWGALVRSRGPPEAGATILVDYRYEYDSTNRRVITYDVTTLRYAIYDWKDFPKNPRLLEQGNFALDNDGNVIAGSRTATRTYNAEILGPVSVPATEYDTELAYAAASALLAARPGIDAALIQRSGLVIDPSDSGKLTVALTYEDVQYSYTYASATQQAVLTKTRTPNADGETFSIVLYDAQGRKISKSKEDAEGEVTLLETYRYEKEGEIITIDEVKQTITISTLSADGTVTFTLRTGAFGTENASGPCYALRGVNEDAWIWYDYGADKKMLTADDQVTTAPERGPEVSQARGRRGGGDTYSDTLLLRLLKEIRSFQECMEEKQRRERTASNCEEYMSGISSLQKQLENEQYRNAGVVGLTSGGGEIYLNYYNLVTPAMPFLPAQIGQVAAPLYYPYAPFIGYDAYAN